MSGWGDIIDHAAELEADEEPERPRRRKRWAGNKPAALPPPLPKPKAPDLGAVLVLAEPERPTGRSAAAFDAYLAARARAGQDHRQVVLLDIAWGRRSQAIHGGVAAAERWAKLAEWFEAWPAGAAGSRA